MSDQRIWMIRVPKGQEIIQKVRDERLVGISYRVVEDISQIQNKNQLKDVYQRSNPDASSGRINSAAGQLFRFTHEIKIGDIVLTPDRDKRSVLYGKIVSGYLFSSDGLFPGKSHSRKVEWNGEFNRDDMSTSLKNSAGSLSTVFNLDKHKNELLRLMKQEVDSPIEPIPDDETDEETSFYDDTKAKADEHIADLISGIDPYDFQDLVGGLLQAMGYRTRVSDPGPDHGVDIFAHPDAFGFETPRIKVQVKHRSSTAGGPDIRNLIGTLGEGEKGLFVSTGGFTSEAKIEARRNPRVTLVDSDELVKLLIEYYDNLSPDYRAIVPLRRIWVPFAV